jgi:hypothetical protein
MRALGAVLLFALSPAARAAVVETPPVVEPVGGAVGTAAAAPSAALAGPAAAPAFAVRAAAPDAGPVRAGGAVSAAGPAGAARPSARGDLAAADREASALFDGSGGGAAAEFGAGRALTPAEVPPGMLNEKVLASFFSPHVTARRAAAARRLVALRAELQAASREPLPAGIAYLGDTHAGALDAYKSAKAILTDFTRRGQRVLVVAGHGAKGPGGSGAVIPGRNGEDPYFYADTAWGALELRDVLLRAGYRLDGYDKILFATCHGGAACHFAMASTAEVWATNPEGVLHYASGQVMHHESGYGMGVFPDADYPDATKIYAPGVR